MNKLLLEIEEEISRRFPDVRSGGFLVEQLDTASGATGAHASQWESARSELLGHGLTIENLTADPRIAAWRHAFRLSGLKPSAYRSSPEQLARRLLKGENIATPLPIVNAYCAVSARNLAPMGGYDLDRLTTMKVTLRYARPEQDNFHPLGGRREDMPLTPTVAVYACDAEIICWSFNHRDSRLTCLEQHTQRALFLSEAISMEQHHSIAKALEELRQTLSANGAVVGDLAFVESHSPQIELSV